MKQTTQTNLLDQVSSNMRGVKERQKLAKTLQDEFQSKLVAFRTSKGLPQSINPEGAKGLEEAKTNTSKVNISVTLVQGGRWANIIDGIQGAYNELTREELNLLEESKGLVPTELVVRCADNSQTRSFGFEFELKYVRA